MRADQWFRMGTAGIALAVATACGDDAVTNVTPAADAGTDIEASIGESVTLNGAVTDPDPMQTLTFTWTQVSGPAVGNLSGQNPTFTAPSEVSTIEFDLTVGDGLDTSPPDRIVIWVLEDKTAALWVNGATGDDANSGTRAAPFATIQAAIDAADAAGAGADIYVAAGTYAESVTLRDQVSLYGGFSDVWLREIQSNETIIDGGPTAVTGSSAGALTLDGLTMRSADAGGPGESSVGVALDDSSDVVRRRPG